MSAAVRVDRSLRTVFFTFSGVLTDEELQRVQDEWLTHPDFDASFNRLVDAREIDLAVSSDCVRLTAWRAVMVQPARYAIVAKRDTVFGLARMYEMTADTRGAVVRVFRDMAEARAWIGLDPASESEPPHAAANHRSAG